MASRMVEIMKTVSCSKWFDEDKCFG